MIVRIMGEGQLEVAENHLDSLNALDAEVEAAVTASDEAAFTRALSALLDHVRRVGQPTPDDDLSPSELVLPPAESTVEDVRHLMEDDGLIPG